MVDYIYCLLNVLIFSERLINNFLSFFCMILIYVVCKNKEEANKIGKLFVKKKLVACANTFPIDSFYNWDNKFVEDKEFVLLLKTVSDNYKILEKKIKEIHSYDIPAIIKINVEANSAYENWVIENTKS